MRPFGSPTAGRSASSAFPIRRGYWGRWRFLAWRDGLTQDQACAPLEWRLSFINRVPARQARAKVLRWNCRRLIVAHGTWPRQDGNAFLARSFRWLGRTA